ESPRPVFADKASACSQQPFLKRSHRNVAGRSPKSAPSVSRETPPPWATFLSGDTSAAPRLFHPDSRTSHEGGDRMSAAGRGRNCDRSPQVDIAGNRKAA